MSERMAAREDLRDPSGLNTAQADVRAFLDVCESLVNSPFPELTGFLHPSCPIIVGRAPGRLDVMGGIADYSGSLVLQLPTREATLVAGQATGDAEVAIASLPLEPGQPARLVRLTLNELRDLESAGYESAGERLCASVDDAWAAYALGILLVLAREYDWRVDQGLRLLIQSRVPEGKGVSSSAALEVAVMRTVCHLLDKDLEGTELARLCQLAENHVVGAPCGIMDQMTSALGETDHLLALLCQPADVRGFVRLPAALRVWGIDSGIRHAVSGSDYTAVRTGAFMGHRIMTQLAGLQPDEIREDGTVVISDSRWGGYLANVEVDEFEREFASQLPGEISGAEFLATYGGTIDTVTRVDPERTYAVQQPAAHPVYEHARVSRFADLLAREIDEPAMREMGQLMFQSHDSYSACGLGSDGTDRIVELVRQVGPERGLFGAKITGGGSGGTVAVLGRRDAQAAIDDVVSQYGRETGRDPVVFAGSSPGACRFPPTVCRFHDGHWVSDAG